MQVELELITNPVESAKAAGLRYVTDDTPSIRRKRAGRGFRYISVNGKPVCDPNTLRRIKSLAIPPAWTEVWICPIPDGHIQATGRDAKGRKQYRYHPHWWEERDETKYSRMIAFGEALPLIRKRVERDIALPGLPRKKVLATVVRLLEATLIRIGNEEYTRANGSFGLTTMRNRHVDVSGSTLRFHFRGKSGKHHTVEISDRRLAKIVKRCQDIPGYELFQYLDDSGNRQTIDSADVNEYLREIVNQDFTAKDFRTWAGTVLAMITLREFGPFNSEVQVKKNIVRAIEVVAERLGNTPAICRKCYVHPALINHYLDGMMFQMIEQIDSQEIENLSEGLRPEEVLVLVFLRQCLVHENGREGL
ncbi:MAG: DNA topoisomerase IB [Ignavibacteriales bacterium]